MFTCVTPSKKTFCRVEKPDRIIYFQKKSKLYLKKKKQIIGSAQLTIFGNKRSSKRHRNTCAYKSVVLIDLGFGLSLWQLTADRINIILELYDYDKIQISIIMHETSFSVWSLLSVFSSSHKKSSQLGIINGYFMQTNVSLKLTILKLISSKSKVCSTDKIGA